MQQRSAVTVAVFVLFAAVWLAIVWRYIPAHYSYDWDSSQLGRGVTEFNIAKHQPHPPGYPVWVAAAAAIARLDGSIPGAMSILALAFSLAAFVAFGLLARETIEPGSRWAAVFLLAFSPPVLFYSAAQASYSADLFVSCMSGYFAVKVAKATPRSFFFFCLFLGIGIGLRQSAAMFLFPLFCYCAYLAWRRSKVETLAALAVGGLAALTWLVPLVKSTGGLANYQKISAGAFRGYMASTSIFFGAPPLKHLSMMVDVTAWMAVAVAGAAVYGAAAGLGRNDKPSVQPPRRSRQLLILWGAPNLAFALLFHCPKPGYLLLTLPAAVLVLVRPVGAGFNPRRTDFAAILGVAASLAISYFPYNVPSDPSKGTLQFQLGRFMVPAVRNIEADNELLGNTLLKNDANTPVICLHWSGEAPNCRSAPWDFPVYQWVGSQGQRFAASLPMGAEALFLCDRAGPSDNWKSKMRNWTQLAEGWQMSVWRATK